LGIAKGGDAAFRGYASACEHGHAFGSGKALDQFSRNRHGWIVAPFETTNNAATTIIPISSGIGVERNTPVFQTGIQGAIP
jgi:hypothetical protein